MRNSQCKDSLRGIIAFAFLVSGAASAVFALTGCAATIATTAADVAHGQTAVAIDEKTLDPTSRDWERILPVATDLKADGIQAKAERKPILLFFNLQGCHFCRYSLRTVVVPMFRDPQWRDAMLFRQITIDDEKSLLDFGGKRVKNIEFTTARKGNFTPTVMMVDGDGILIGEPIVGIANADYYGGYVEALSKKAIEEVRARK
jgi:thioredoxin-related protein